jgi:nucleotidyltransferase/DNA polymerase involved in DNA repair
MIPFQILSTIHSSRQWNSALAVNYPARKFEIKRGDSFEAIQEKSKGKCISIHLPLLSIKHSHINSKEQESPAAESKQNGGEKTGFSSVDEAYSKEFELSEQDRKDCFVRERNKMRHSHEGKASLER